MSMFSRFCVPVLLACSIFICADDGFVGNPKGLNPEFDTTEWEVEAVKDGAKMLWRLAQSIGVSVSSFVTQFILPELPAEQVITEVVDGSCTKQSIKQLMSSPTKNPKRRRKN